MGVVAWPTMRVVATILLSLSSFTLSEDHSCSSEEKCLPQKKCPGFWEKKQKLTDLKNSGKISDYRALLKDLKSQVCDSVQKKVCCEQTEECGQAQIVPANIIGGSDSDKGEFPFLALIGHDQFLTKQCLLGGCKNITEKRWDCGGSIISRHFVLTAAHCQPRVDTFIVRVGEHELEGYGVFNDGSEVTDFEIPKEKFIVHENYESRKPPFVNDIALIRLPSPVKPSQVIQVVCLPVESLVRNTDTSGVVVGWGKTANGQSLDALTGAFTSKQQKLEVPILTECNQKLVDHDTQICAGGERGKDSCNGDSGGGLFWRKDLKSNDPWYLVGIVSFGSRKCGTGRSAVYTRVSAFHTWIQRKMEEYK